MLQGYMIKLLIAGAVAVAAHGGHHHSHSSASGRSLLGEEEPEYFGRGGPNGDGCGQKHLEEKYPTVKAEASAEGAAILEKYIKLQEAEGGSDQRVGKYETFEIPMVFHVLNQPGCTDAHIRANIKQMNLDFQQLNDQSNIPDDVIPGFKGKNANGPDKSFKGVVGNPMISFQLDSIIRKTAVFPAKGKTWTDKDCEMVALSPPKNPLKFMNVYVAELEAGLLGYAFFPPKTLSSDAVFNHVVMAGGAIGGADKKGAFYKLDLGRTLAHETGHYLGLEHTFGNANKCASDDGFEDTPKTISSMGCPSYPTKKCGNEIAQTMNFMDYVDDACMSMFTKEQATKMRSVLDRDIGQRRCLGTSKSKESEGSAVSDNSGVFTPLDKACNRGAPAPKECGAGGTFAPRETDGDEEASVTDAPKATGQDTLTTDDTEDTEDTEEQHPVTAIIGALFAFCAVCTFVAGLCRHCGKKKNQAAQVSSSTVPGN